MGIKEKLALEYIELKKEFDGDKFLEGIASHQVSYLKNHFKAIDLKDKIAAVKRAIEQKNLRLRKEVFFESEEGKAYKEKYQTEITELENQENLLTTEFETWVTNCLLQKYSNKSIAQISPSYKGFTLEIGIRNQDPKRQDFIFEFGHSFNIYFYFDLYNSENKIPRFQIRYGTMGAFNALTDNLRKEYLALLSGVSNDNEWLTLLMDKGIEYTNSIYELNNKINKVEEKINNPF